MADIDWRPTFAGVPARKMRPTMKHRPAMWENMLGTVYAANDAGEVRYFDYDWDAAAEFCGANLEGADCRIAKTVGGAPPGRGRRHDRSRAAGPLGSERVGGLQTLDRMVQWYQRRRKETPMTKQKCQGKRRMQRGRTFGTYKCGRDATTVMETRVGLSKTHYVCDDPECSGSIAQGYPAYYRPMAAR